MKWIGQHIYDYIARFRSDIYLESISSGTIASGGYLGLDSNNKIVKSSETGDITAVTITTDSGGGSAASDTGGSADFSILGSEGVGVTNSGTTISVVSVPDEIDHDSLLNFASNEHFTMAGIDSIGTAGTTTNIAAGDLTMYNAVNDGNPTISLGSSATNRFEIKTVYNSSAQTIDSVDFTTYTTSASSNDGRYRWFVDEVELTRLIDSGLNIYGNVSAIDADAQLAAVDTTTSSATQGGRIRLTSDDGAAMADDHRLGVIEFRGAEDSSSTYSTGARIQAICRDAWDGSNNDADLEFYTTNGTTESKVLTLDADGLATLDGDLTVNGDTVTFVSGNADDPTFTIKNTADDNQAARLTMTKDRGAAMADNDRIGEIDFFGEDDGQNIQQYSKIIVQAKESAHGDEAGQFKLQVSNDGTLRTGLLISGDKGTADEVDVELGNEATSTTTIKGTLTMGSTAAMTNAGLVAVANQSNITGLGTITSGTWQGTAIATTYIADDAVTFAKASGVTPNVYGSIIKLLPSDFVTNDDGGASKFGIGYVDSAGSSYGMKPTNAATELYAFVSIPEGMKATHVDVYDKDDLAIEVFEIQINATTMTSKGSGNCNTTLDITDVNATATNMLAIQVTTTATSNRVFGGKVTIAAQ